MVKQNCSISQWLKNYDKDLWNAIEESCSLSLFRIRGAGITFLYPTNTTLRKTLITKLKDNDFSGVQLLKSLIIVGYLDEISAWEEQKDDIPNKLGINIKVADITGDKVILDNKAAVKLFDKKKFAPREDRENMAVWEYNGANGIMDGEKSTYKYAKKKPDKAITKETKARGGAGNNTQLKKMMHAKHCEAAAESLLADSAYCKNNPYLLSVVSYLRFIENNPDTFAKMLKRISYSPEASFYNIFQPYNSNENTPLFDIWYNKMGGITFVKSPVDTFNEYVMQAANVKNAAAARKLTCECRNILLDQVHPQILRQKLAEQYSKNSTLFKARMDETLFTIILSMYKICRITQASEMRSAFRDMCAQIRAIQNNNAGYSIFTTDLSSINDINDVACFYSNIVLFVMSDCFMYVPYIMNDNEQTKQLLTDKLDQELHLIPLPDLSLDNIKHGGVFVQMLIVPYMYLQELNKNADNPQKKISLALEYVRPGEISDTLMNVMSKIVNKAPAPAQTN